MKAGWSPPFFKCRITAWNHPLDDSPTFFSLFHEVDRSSSQTWRFASTVPAYSFCPCLFPVILDWHVSSNGFLRFLNQTRFIAPHHALCFVGGSGLAPNLFIELRGSRSHHLIWFSFWFQTWMPPLHGFPPHITPNTLIILSMKSLK